MVCCRRNALEFAAKWSSPTTQHASHCRTQYLWSDSAGYHEERCGKNDISGSIFGLAPAVQFSILWLYGHAAHLEAIADTLSKAQFPRAGSNERSEGPKMPTRTGPIECRLGRAFKLHALLSAWIIVGGIAFLPSDAARAAEFGAEPRIKGFTDIYAGILPSEPGFYFRTDAYHYEASVERTVFNGFVQVAVEQDLTATIATLTYVTPWKISRRHLCVRRGTEHAGS